jgi:hypothetical protein
MPDKIFYGGYGIGYEDFNWNEYVMEGSIQPYYAYYGERPFGRVTIWSRIKA